jgi:hypothetical protein
MGMSFVDAQPFENSFLDFAFRGRLKNVLLSFANKQLSQEIPLSSYYA